MIFYKQLKQFYTSNFYLMIPICIIIVSCIGAFAAYYITIKGMNTLTFSQLVISVLGAMAYLTAVLGQLKKETTFTVLVLSIAVEILLLALNLIF